MYIEVALVVVVVKPPTQNDAFHIVYHSLICLVFFLFQRNFRSLRFFLLVCLIVFGCLSARLTCVASLRVCSKRYAGICLLLCLSPIILFFGRISKYVRLNSLPITHSPTYLVYDYFVVVVSLFFARCFRIRMQAFVLTIYVLFSFRLVLSAFSCSSEYTKGYSWCCGVFSEHSSLLSQKRSSKLWKTKIKNKNNSSNCSSKR